MVGGQNAVAQNGATINQARRDINLIQKPLEGLQRMINELRANIENDPGCGEYIQKLNKYMSERPRRIVGLEAKLIDGGREDLIDDAIYLKGEFVKRLEKSQLSEARQKVYVHILALINSSFSNNILNMIRDGADNKEVDSEIFNTINEIYAIVCDPAVDLDMDELRGMMFFLTGNCHIIWR